MRKELAAMPGMAVTDKRGYELLKSMCDALSPCTREEDVRETCMKLFQVLVTFEMGPCLVKYILAQALVQYGILLENSFAHSLGCSYNPGTSTKEEIEMHDASMAKIRGAIEALQSGKVQVNDAKLDDIVNEYGQRSMVLEEGMKVWYHADRQTDETLNLDTPCIVCKIGEGNRAGQTQVFGMNVSGASEWVLNFRCTVPKRRKVEGIERRIAWTKPSCKLNMKYLSVNKMCCFLCQYTCLVSCL